MTGSTRARESNYGPRRMMLDQGEPIAEFDIEHSRKSNIAADEAFQALMLAAGHKQHVVTEPSTDHPRFMPLRGLPVSGGSSPAQACADHSTVSLTSSYR